MNPYTDDDLLAMMQDLESDCVERKQSFSGNAPRTVREAVCAFANDLPGHGAPGVIFIGADDDGNPVDLDVTDELLRQLADIKTDGQIAPPPTLLVEKRRLQNHDLAVITVWPSDTPPVRFKGRIHVRWGPRRGLASAQDERILDEAEIHGTVVDQIRRIEDKMEAHNAQTVRFTDVEREERTAAYPMDALRQLVRNAHMHRSYEATHSPVRVYWFDDRIEIHNPGGPYGAVTPENFGQPGVTDYRNPNLAEALRALGFVQRFGAGIALARKALGERLRFDVQQGFVAAIVESAR